MHGFRLEDSQRHYIINASTQPPIYADTCFVNFLLRRRLLIERPADKRQDGDTLVYWNREFPVHAGRAASRRVHSKWGTGLMFDHEILEVPLSYGSIITCYEPVDVATAEQHFLEYARCMGYNPGAA